MIAGRVLDTDWVSSVDGKDFVIAVAEDLFIYFDKEQNKQILDILTGNFVHGFLAVEMMRPNVMDEKKHETVKHTNAKFGWGTNSGKEFEELNSKMKLVSEHSFAEQLRKSTPIAKLIGVVSAKINNRIAVFHW